MKVIPPKSIALLCEQLHAEGAVVVFTCGVFDLLHPGHIHMLREARKLGTHLIVGLYGDDDMEQNQPVMPLEQRAEILAALEMVSYVTWIDRSVTELLRQIRPHFLVNGDVNIAEIVQSFGGKTVQIPLVGGYSTDNILERIIKSSGN
jgi:D-beta-D-heptose 7-phosphate kinase/D-beta-D-heptose 1-phosphate adenosyltransferase